MASMAVATTSHAAASVEDCQADLEVLASAVLPAMPAGSGMTNPYAGAPVEYRDGRCVTPQFRTPQQHMGAGMLRRFVIGSLSWQADWSEGERVFPPLALSLAVESFHQEFTAEDGMPEMAYIQNMMLGTQRGSLQLEFRTDPEARSLDLTRLEITPNGFDRLVLSAKLTDIDLRGMAGGPSLSPDALLGIGVTDIDLTLSNRAFFETMAGLWLRAIYPAMGETPEQAVEAAKAMATGFIATIPDGLSSDDSRAALTALVTSLPHPTGDLHMTLQAADGLTAGEIAPAFVMGTPSWKLLEEPLRDTRIEAEWTPVALP